MDLNLKDRVILVTGANRGIGRAIAESAVAEGAIAVVLGRDAAACEDTVQALGPDRSSWITADVADPAEAERAVAAVVERHGRLDGVVNNAGRFGGGSIAVVKPESLKEGFDTKVVGSIALVQAALPALRKSDQARVVNIAGISAQRIMPAAPVTAIANAGVITLSAYLARELINDGVTVNCVIPGYVLTDPWRGRTQEVADAKKISFDEALIEVLKGQDLAHARWGTPKEIADVVVFLLSAQAAFVNGAAFRVDGGQFLSVQR